MLLNTIKRKNDNKAKRPRVGRGGKRGTSSGKGTKGQKSRSGHRIRPALREYIQRLPKLRGYANKSVQDEAAVVNVGQLAKLSGVINRTALIKAGLARASSAGIKVLGNGEITTAVTLEGLKVSASAKMKIEKAGGKIS